jgi:hypothetical protein
MKSRLTADVAETYPFRNLFDDSPHVQRDVTDGKRPNLFVRCFISAAMELLGLTVGGDASAGAVVRLRRCSVST